MIKGYKKTEDLDYFDTYPPVTRINSIKIVLVISTLRNLEVHQMDVKATFLNGDLGEEIYMEHPEGFFTLAQENKVCKLVKSLYGLKQAPKQWHEKFDNIMMSQGFKINECDKCVYVKDIKYVYSGIARIPIDVTPQLSKNKGECVSQVEYSRVISGLM